jgi:serine/threonine-protein kinase
MMKYRLTEKIGSGGMAEVFRAVGEGPEGFERPFVIKRIHPRLSEAPEFVRMFVDEAKISARLIHPNIVQVFEFAYQDGGYYIVMEPVEGVDMGWLLRQRLARRREVPPPAFVAEVGRQACRGLDFAHTLCAADGTPLGIVHRDVTPPNIMVAWNGTVKILDFGIARAVQALRTNMTDAGMVKGKMSYVAPELLDGKTADARADVFSLGVVLHELLSGRQLFSGENDLETLKLVREMPIPLPSARNPGVKRALDNIVMRALERDPEKRYRSAGEMGDDLETVVLRERYSTRALARKARELTEPAEGDEPAEGAATAAMVEATADDADAAVETAPAEAAILDAAAVAVPPTSIGRESSPVVMDEAAKRPPAAPRPPATPPRLPAQAAAVRRATPGPIRRMADHRRWSWAAIGLPALIAGALMGALARRPTAVALPARAAPSAPALPATVQVTVDSVPQGATVTATLSAPPAGATPGATAGASEGPTALPAGRRLGDTPVLLNLPRGQAPVELVLTKQGFIPLLFKVIPHQDKEVVARLDRVVVAPLVAASGPTGRAGSARSFAPARHAATPAQRRASFSAAAASLPPRATGVQVAAATAAATRPTNPTQARPPVGGATAARAALPTALPRR